MYRMFQFFVLALKIDIFTEFLVSLFYVIQFGLKLDSVKWEVGIQVAVTILILPMLYFARTAVSGLFFTALSKKENVLIWPFYREAPKATAEWSRLSPLKPLSLSITLLYWNKRCSQTITGIPGSV